MGSAKAAVFPVPVWAVPIRSLPARIIGKARSWIGVGSVKPIAWVPRTTSGESPKLLNDTSRSYRDSCIAQRTRRAQRITSGSKNHNFVSAVTFVRDLLDEKAAAHLG